MLGSRSGSAWQNPAVQGEDASAQIALRTFVIARWVLLGLITLGWGVQILHPPTWNRIIYWFPPPPEPGGTAAVMVVLVVLNVVTQRWILRPSKATRNIAGAHLMVDAAALTALLALSGGVSNSFTTMFFVPLTLATQISLRWTWIIALWCLAGFAFLFLITPDVTPGVLKHLRGMWVAFALSGAFMTYFVHRIALSLSRQREELTSLRDAANQDRHLAAIGTMAAGAAHELGSPLGTVSALVGDLNYMADEERDEAISTIKQQIRRCKHILHQMASPELRVPTLGHENQPWSLRDLEDELREAAGETRLRIVFTPSITPSTDTVQPREALGQILRELVTNGVEACSRRPGAKGIEARFDYSGRRGQIEITVSDDGVGMDAKAAAAAFDPFYSTKDEGKGMGLGLYLARAHLRQLGGGIELRSSPGSGTTVVVRFPLTPPGMDAQGA